MISIYLTILLLAAGPPSQAPTLMCSCIEEPMAEEIKKADLIFEGIALKKVRYPANWREFKAGDFQPLLGFGDSEYIFFLADRIWKGSRLNDLMISTPSQPPMCGYDFKVGERYLVYASIVESQIMTSICTPTKPAAAADADRRKLDSRYPD